MGDNETVVSASVEIPVACRAWANALQGPAVQGAKHALLAAADRIEALEKERDDLLHDLARIKDSETHHLNRAEALQLNRDRSISIARREALEEAARVAMLSHDDRTRDPYARAEAHHIADAIRAMKEKE